MKIIRVTIVDDERVGRSRLRRLLEVESDVEIVGECGDGPSALSTIREEAPDIVLLDISMPGVNGFDVLDALGPQHQPPVVIFVTAHDEHAVRAFEACALDYLLKPVSPERLAKALTRARQQLPVARVRATGALAESAPQLHAQRFVVRSGGRVSFVAHEEIDWVEAAGNYAILHVGPQNHMLRETMSALEAKLADSDFLRISRSAIVNLRRVKELKTVFGGETAAVLLDDQRVAFTIAPRDLAARLAAL